MGTCNKCGSKINEYFQWKFEYGLKKLKIHKCSSCNFKKELDMVDL